MATSNEGAAYLVYRGAGAARLFFVQPLDAGDDVFLDAELQREH